MLSPISYESRSEPRRIDFDIQLGSNICCRKVDESNCDNFHKPSVESEGPFSIVEPEESRTTEFSDFCENPEKTLLLPSGTLELPELSNHTGD